MILRPLEESDYQVVIIVIDKWWGGRHMTDMLPKLFFRHFKNTSFAVEENGELVGFLIGFISQSYVDETYIHLVGIHPAHRKKGIGEWMYLTFLKRFPGRGVRLSIV